MSDLTPFYLHARGSRDAQADAQAGAEALAQFGPQGEVKVQTDVNAIDTSKVPGRPAQEPPAEPQGALKLEGAPAQEQQPHRSEGAAAAGDVANRVPYSDALNMLTHHIANTENPEQFRQQMIEAFRKDPRNFEAGLQQLLTATGLSMPAVNAMMTLTRDELTKAGAPNWAATAGEYLAGAVIPSRMAYGAASGLARPAARFGAATLEARGVKAAVPSLDLGRTLAGDLEKNGGFSYSLNGKRAVQFPEGTFGVSIAPELERTVQGKARPEDIAKYIEENRQVLTDPRAAFGGWYDAKTDRTHLDVSVGAQGQEGANKLGSELGQRAIYNPATGESAPVAYGSGGPHPYNAPAEPLKPQDIATAQAYDQALSNPALKPQWDALAAETDRLYAEISKKVRVEPVAGQPYASADQMAREVQETGILKVSTDNSQHPFWTPEQNTRFRAVHDFLGHLGTGNDFSLEGEYRAWLAHETSITDEAAKTALKTEVYGQAASAIANSGRFSEQKAVDLGKGLAPIEERLARGVDLNAPQKTTRLYRAENAAGEGPFGQSIYAGETEGKPQGRFFTSSQENAQSYLNDVKGGGRISYLDVTNPEKYQGKLAGEYLVPEAVAKGRRPLAESPQGLVEAAGAKLDGISDIGGGTQGAWFTDPKTGSTLLLPLDKLTPENIALHLAESRKAWGLGDIAAGAAGAVVGSTLQGGNDPYAGTALGAAVGIGTGNLKLLRSATLVADIAKMGKASRLANALTADASATMLRQGYDAASRKLAAYQVPAERMDAILARAKEVSSNGLLDLKKQMIGLEDAFPYWRAADSMPDWYGSPATLRKTFGPDSRLMAGLLAATSPQQNAAKANIDAALGVYRILKTEPESEWRSIISKENREVTKLFGVAGENTVPNVWRAIKGEDLSGNKVNDFFHALLGDESVFTVDRHMVGSIAPDWSPAAGAGKGLNDAEYATFADWGKEFASRIGETPRYTQQRLWVGYRINEFIEEATGAGNQPFFENLANRAADQGILDLVPKASFLDEAGRTRAGVAWVLGRTAAGALVGSELGDTTEERLRNAMIGAGAIGVAPAAITKLTKWVTENAPSIRSLVRKPIAQYPPAVGQDLDRMFTGYEADLNAFTRGVRPHSLAWAQADQMIRDGRISLDSVRQSFPGKTMNDSEAMAFIKTVADYGQGVQAFASGLQDTVRSGKPLAPEQIDGLLSRLFTMREFLPKPRGVVAEAGRTLSAMNEPTSGLNQYLAQWHSLFTDPVRGLSPEKLVDAIAGMDSVEQHAALARLAQQPGWTDMAIEGLYGALLGGPVTQVVNGLSNTIALAYAPIERLGSAVMGDIVKWNEPFAMLYGYAQAVPMAFSNAKRAFLTGERTIGGFSKVESPTGPISGVTSQYLESSFLGKLAETAVPLATAAAMYSAGVDPSIAIASGVSMHPRFWPLGPRAMVASDELFKTMLFNGEKWAQAVRRGAAVDPKFRSQVLFETVQNPSSTVKNAATQFANEFTYNSPPGPLLQGLMDGMNSPDLPGAYKVLAKTVLPFTNIPSNLMKFVGRRTPGLQQLHAQWWADINTPGPRQDTAMGQLTMGAAWLAGVAKFAADGGIVGSGPADPNQLREWLADGNQEYAARFGDKTFSINRMDPWGQMASIVADWSAISAHVDNATNDQIAAALLMVVSKDMMSKTYLEGASTFLDAITNKDPNKAYHWLYQYTGTPVPALIRQFRSIEDPYMREVRDLVDSAMNKVPEFSKNLAPRKNLFAEPIMDHEPIGYGIDYVNPFKMKTIKNDPATKAVLDNKISVSMPSWSIYGDGAKNFTLDPQRESVGVPLTHGLRDELIDLMGKPLKAEWLKFINSSEYDPKNLGPDSANALVFKQLHQHFAKAAVATLVDKHPELLKGLEDALTRRATALSTPMTAPRPATGPSILQRLQGVGAPAPTGATQ